MTFPKGTLTPSLETFKLWRKKAQWIIYLDVAMTSLCILQILTVIAGAATWHNWWLLIWSLPPAVTNAALSLSSLFFATRRRLHPTFALSQSVIMTISWGGCLFLIWNFGNLSYALRAGEDPEEWAGREDLGNGSVMWVQIICAHLTGMLYIPYLTLASMAVQYHRRLKSELAHQGATVNLQDFAPHEDSAARPKDGRDSI